MKYAREQERLRRLADERNNPGGPLPYDTQMPVEISQQQFNRQRAMNAMPQETGMGPDERARRRAEFATQGVQGGTGGREMPGIGLLNGLLGMVGGVVSRLTGL